VGFRPLSAFAKISIDLTSSKMQGTANPKSICPSTVLSYLV